MSSAQRLCTTISSNLSISAQIVFVALGIQILCFVAKSIRKDIKVKHLQWSYYRHSALILSICFRSRSGTSSSLPPVCSRNLDQKWYTIVTAQGRHAAELKYTGNWDVTEFCTLASDGKHF